MRGRTVPFLFLSALTLACLLGCDSGDSGDSGTIADGFGPDASADAVVRPQDVTADVAGVGDVPAPPDVPGPLPDVPGPLPDVPGPLPDVPGPPPDVPGPPPDVPQPPPDAPQPPSDVPQPPPDVPLVPVAPTIEVTRPAGDEPPVHRADGVVVEYRAADADSAAEVSLYYDADGTGGDGTLIVSGLVEDDRGYPYTYRWTDPPPGTWYVRAVIDDGEHAPVTAYAAGPVRVYGFTESIVLTDVESPCLAFTPAGQPAVLYVQEGAVRLTTRGAGDSWASEVLEEVGDTRATQACAFAPDGTFGAAILDRDRPTDERVFYLGGTSGAWSTDPVPFAWTTNHGAFAFDRAGEPAFCWTESFDEGVRLARRQGGVWTEEIVVEGVAVNYCALSFTAAGEPYVVYGGGETHARTLSYASRVGGTWQSHEIADLWPYAHDWALANDAGGAPAVGFVPAVNDTETGLPAVARLADGWQLDAVPDADRLVMGYATSLTFGRGDASLVYLVRDWVGIEVVLAERTPTGWDQFPAHNQAGLTPNAVSIAHHYRGGAPEILYWRGDDDTVTLLTWQ